jgi:type II secretory pathway pseudopilin PulG
MCDKRTHGKRDWKSETEAAKTNRRRTTMKTYANPSHHGINNTGERERAFTLTDLLVVMATLAILATVILPALAKSGDNGARTVCLNNLRQLGTASNMYLTDDQDYLPWPNWGCDASPPCPAGWLYAGNPNSPNNLQNATPANWSTGRVANLKTDVYWQYLQNPDVFMCPVFAATVVGTKGPAPGFNWQNYNNKLSTYCMNGASAFFPATSPANMYGYKTTKASQIWSPLCIILWEPSGTSGNGNGYNDGANYPDSSEGVSRLHVTGAPVLAVGGGSRFMSFTDLTAEMNHPLRNDNFTGKGLLWWNPLRRDGHGVSE